MLETIGVHAPPVKPQLKESYSNGAVSNAVKVFKGMLRVHVLALERNMGARVPTKYPVMGCLLEHVSDAITKCFRRMDRRTGYQRLFGKQVHEEGLGVG